MKKLGYYPKQSRTFASLCDQADERFFFKVRYNNAHPLHCLLPTSVIKTHKTRPGGHPFQLPTKTTSLDECNFIIIIIIITETCKAPLEGLRGAVQSNVNNYTHMCYILHSYIERYTNVYKLYSIGLRCVFMDIFPMTD